MLYRKEGGGRGRGMYRQEGTGKAKEQGGVEGGTGKVARQGKA